MATIYKTQGQPEEVHPKNGTFFSLEEMQAIVGGYIQFVYLPEGMIMVMDEEGKLKNKTPNEKATAIAKQSLFADDYIVGDVLVTHENFIE